ncbi:hypothetical protein ACF0H5_001521 [Mactra antiquata]
MVTNVVRETVETRQIYLIRNSGWTYQFEATKQLESVIGKLIQKNSNWQISPTSPNTEYPISESKSYPYLNDSPPALKKVETKLSNNKSMLTLYFYLLSSRSLNHIHFHV